MHFLVHPILKPPLNLESRVHLLLTIVISESTAVLHFRCTEHWHTLAHSVRRQQSATTQHKAVRQAGTCSPPFTPLLSTAILFLSLSFSLSLSSHRHWLQTISECSLTHSPSSAHNCTPTDAGADTTTKHSHTHTTGDCYGVRQCSLVVHHHHQHHHHCS